MRKYSRNYGDPVRTVYLKHKATAKYRGIPFLLTFEQWVRWWKRNLGPNWFELRASLRTGQTGYVMARKGDEGPYALGNIKCITHEANSSESLINGRRKGIVYGACGVKHGCAKLTEEQVKEIFLSEPPNIEFFMNRYRVSRSTIDAVRSGRYWKHITSKL